MHPKFVNIHTHTPSQSAAETIYAYMIGSGENLPQASVASEAVVSGAVSSEAVVSGASVASGVVSGASVASEAVVSRVRYSAGIHPWDAEKGYSWSDEVFTSGLVAVGEIGLDYSRDVDRIAQKKCFVEQLQLALKHRLPVIIHCVRAYDDLLAIMSDKQYSDLWAKTVIHGFTGSVQLAKTLLDRGFYLSFGARTFDSPKTIAALLQTPTDRLFLETDAAEITIEQVYEQVAKIKQLDICSLQNAIYTNYVKIFG